MGGRLTYNRLLNVDGEFGPPSSINEELSTAARPSLIKPLATFLTASSRRTTDQSVQPKPLVFHRPGNKSDNSTSDSLGTLRFNSPERWQTTLIIVGVLGFLFMLSICGLMNMASRR